MASGVAVGRKKSDKAAREPREFGTLVRIADDVADDGRAVAAIVGTSMAKLFSDTLRPILKQMLVDELEKRTGKPPTKKAGPE
jgi:hypothetical protein